MSPPTKNWLPVWKTCRRYNYSPGAKKHTDFYSGKSAANLVKIVDSGDEADVASDAVDRTLLDSLSAQDAQRLRLIDNALDRIRQGKYGLCAKCGKEIPQARLEALPYALMCVACASAEERRRR